MGRGRQDRPFPGTETASTKKNHLNALMRTEIEVELGGMRDADIDGRSGRNVSGFSGLLFLVGTEKSGTAQSE